MLAFWCDHNIIIFEVIAVDARNHGESSHTAHMDYVLMADDINNLFEELNITQAHLLGHSMGGKTAMKFALRHVSW